MKKTASLAVAIIVAAMLFLTACGGGGNGGDNTKVYITIADRPANLNGVNSFIVDRQDEFDRLYGDKIVVNHIQDPLQGGNSDIEGFQDIINVLTPVNAPTILPVQGNNTIRTLAQTGLIKSWSGVIDEWDEFDDMDEGALDSVTVGGEIMAFPYSIDVPLLGFSIKVLKQLAIREYPDNEYPDVSERNALRAAFEQQLTEEILDVDTWEKYREVALKLTTPQISGAGVWMSSYHLGFGVWNAANGWEIAEQNSDGSITLDYTADSVLETIEFIRTLREDGSYTLRVDEGLNGIFGQIFDDKVASFVFYPSWYASWFASSGFNRNDIITIPYPKGPNAVAKGVENTNLVFSSGYVLSKHCTDEEAAAAQKYLEFMWGKEGWDERFAFAQEENIADLLIPTLKTISTDAVYSNIPENWASALVNGRNNGFYITVNSEAYMTTLTTYLPQYASLASYPTMQGVIASLQDRQQKAITENTIINYVAKQK